MSETPLFSAISATPKRLADSVADAIAQLLLDGRIAPGEDLPSEGKIASEFGVSKPIAREALRNLSAAGLIETHPGKLARAKAMDGEPLNRFYGYAVRSSLLRLREANEMRMVVETGIARLAAQRRGKRGLQMMQAATEDMHKALQNPKKFTEADVAFHFGMAAATGNEMLQMQMEGLRAIQREVSGLFSTRASRTAADWLATVERHETIQDTIVAGDEEGTRKAIEAHYAAADIASLEVADRLGQEDDSDA
ncbi:FadR/GntR family transcriptional regulator [Pseudoruegeria sp. HB172150]|uniref:FadR/GntR family transcriptional regulator n=1 Tax=Pseudoruegeria sp. HB172150 TaxID=2721164 RepID=UPI00352C2AA2